MIAGLFGIAAVAAVVAGVPRDVKANSCAANCRAQHNQCRIATKGAGSCDQRLQQCLQSCMRK